VDLIGPFPFPSLHLLSWDSSVGIETDYGLDGSIPGREKDFTLLNRVQTGCESYPAFHPTDAGGLFSLGIKWAGRESDRLPPSSG
jgi:hypothetical protein